VFATLLANWRLIAIAAACAASAIGGYKIADWQWQKAKNDALEAQLERYHDQAKQFAEAVEERNALQTRLHVVTRRYLAEREKMQANLREKTNAIAQAVDSNTCRLSDAGMQDLACVLRPDTCTATEDNTGSSTTSTGSASTSTGIK
jgi:hypothetical protein